MNKKLIMRIEQIFTEKLSVKTGWGRNEVIDLFTRSVNQAVLENLDQLESDLPILGVQTNLDLKTE